MRHGLAFVILLSGLAWGQGSFKRDNVTDSRGNAIVGASVRVCSKSATGACGQCLPLADIFTDQVLVSPKVPNPIITVSKGEYDFWALPNRYRLDITFSGTCTSLDSYLNSSGNTPPAVWNSEPFTDDGITDGILGVYLPQRNVTLIRLRIRGDRAWTTCAISPTVTVTVPQTAPSPDLVVGTITVRNEVASLGGQPSDYVISATLPMNQQLNANSEVVMSYAHGTCSQRPSTIFATLEMDGER